MLRQLMNRVTGAGRRRPTGGTGLGAGTGPGPGARRAGAGSAEGEMARGAKQVARGFLRRRR